MRQYFWLALIGLVLGVSSRVAAQREIALISPASIRPVLEEILPVFERRTGEVVKVTYGNGGRNKQQVAAAEAIFDVAILQPPYPEVVASGHVAPDSETPIANLVIGVGVKHGAPRPDLATAESVKRMLLSAGSITYPAATSGAAAGVSIDAMFERLGIADEMRPKFRTGSGAIARVATGEVDLYLTFISEMIAPGIDVVGPLPLELCPPTALVGFASARANNAAAARSLLNYLASSGAADAYKAHGMLARLP